MHACMIEGLKVEEGDHVLDIGSGCGVTSALLAYLVRRTAARCVFCLLVKDDGARHSCSTFRALRACLALPAGRGFTMGAVPALLGRCDSHACAPRPPCWPAQTPSRVRQCGAAQGKLELSVVGSIQDLASLLPYVSLQVGKDGRCVGVELREKALDLAHSAMATMSANPECAPVAAFCALLVLRDCVFDVWCTCMPPEHVVICLPAVGR